MTTTRNAIHMPRNFDPTAYEYVGAFDDGDTTPGRHAEYTWLKGLLRDSKTSRFMDRGQCDHCGARIRYVAVLRHTSGDHIAVGETCLDTRASLQSQAAFDAMRRASAEARAEMRIASLRDEFFAANPAVESVLWPVPDEWRGTRAHSILVDMNRKLRRYGNLSERQVAFALRLGDQAVEELARQTVIAAERAAAQPVPTLPGRHTIVGIVVARKYHDNGFGGTFKLTVKHADGWCVWVTEPSNIEANVGDTIKFDAALQISDDNPAFAFGKRPTKASIIESAS